MTWHFTIALAVVQRKQKHASDVRFIRVFRYPLRQQHMSNGRRAPT